MRIAVSVARYDMYVEVRFGLTRLCTVVLKYVHSVSPEGLGRRMRNVSYETVYALHFPGIDVQNRLAMLLRNDEHRSAFVLTLIDLR